MKIRFLKYHPNDAYMQMAIDEAIQIAVSEGKASNTLRFYKFDPIAITYGFSQSTNNFDELKLKKDNVDIVKRLSGGTSVLHKNDFTYSLILKEEELPKLVIDAYKYLSLGLINGLSKLGVDASFREAGSNNRKGVCYINDNPYDIVVGDKKISGNAQFRKNGVALQHGTIILDNNTQELCNYLKLTDIEKEESIKAIKNKVTSVKEVLGNVPDEEVIIESMKCGFEKLFLEKGFEIVVGELSIYEKDLAKKLYLEKYKTNEWNN